MTGVPVELSAEKATLLLTLYGKALDARSPRPVLGDTMAAEAVDKLDYDFAKLKMSLAFATSAAVRTKFFDDWTAEFLATHERATVVQLACGLDTRFWRLDPGPDVEWYDVDYPEVIALRRQVYPERTGYRLIGSSVTAPDWLAEIPVDRPTLVVAEGLTMYLSAELGQELLRRLVDHFGHGQLIFDGQSRRAIKMQNRNKAIRATEATLTWGIDGPDELIRAEPRLRLSDAVEALYARGTDRLPLSTRVVASLLRPIGPLRNLSLYFRFDF
jgi:O-methyltransferase involved in polyketide biosynthesis